MTPFLSFVSLYARIRIYVLDSPAVGVALEPNCGQYIVREAPIFNEDTTYRFAEGRPRIRVYTSINSRFILEDLISKLQLLYGDIT